MSVTSESLTEILKEVVDPSTDKKLGAGRTLREVAVDGNGRVRVVLELGYPAKSHHERLEQLVCDALGNVDGVDSIELEVGWKIAAHAVQQGVKLLPGVRNVIVVASGKGGVGKSTTSANLALALAQEGARVGLLDADIYGPSQAQIMGLAGQRPLSKDGKRMEPLKAHGVQVMSIGNLIDAEAPMVWRGPMVTQALTQLLKDTNWDDLDYLVIDMPPGTGDIQLTLSQQVPVTGAVIVTTPQDIALIDARKGLKMFEKVGVPIVGVVENMSVHICSKCGHEERIFGAGGGEKLCADYDVPFLGALPLDGQIRSEADSGTPTVAAEPEGRLAAIYGEIAHRVAVRIASRARDMTHKFPNVVIQNT